MNKNELLNICQMKKAKSAWDKGVKSYAMEMLQTLDDEVDNVDHEVLMFGAMNLDQLSRSALFEIREPEILFRLATAKEVKNYYVPETDTCKDPDGFRDNYGRFSDWFDVQALALKSAQDLILNL